MTDIRIVCLKRPREEVVASFCQWLDKAFPLPTNHWAEQPALGWHHDLLRTPTYPQYGAETGAGNGDRSNLPERPGGCCAQIGPVPVSRPEGAAHKLDQSPFPSQDRNAGIRRYWDEYHQRVEALRKRFPQHIRLFTMREALKTTQGLKDLLSFAGIKPDRLAESVGIHVDDPPERPKRRRARRGAGSPMDPQRCVILVPFSSTILPQCDRALDQLERRGYDVRRVGGYAAIDQGRNQMATDALLDGYEETMWIDSDIDFNPDSIDRLRSHGLPIAAGIYPQKGRRALASHLMPGAPKIVFGKGGGLVEILYAGGGFLHVRREVYLAIRKRQQLPMCNERFRSPMIPFFTSMVNPYEDGHWYLAEDYAFCQRARASGFKIMADTTIRLWHIGNYSYGWEDAGVERERFESFDLNLGPPAAEGSLRGDGPRGAGPVSAIS